MFAIILNGIVLGCIYALIAAGLNLIWSITDVPDFSQGGIYAVTAYACYFVITLTNLPFIIAIITAALVGATLSFLFEKLLYSRWRGQVTIQLLCAIALFFLLQNSAILLWTAKSRIIPNYINGSLLLFGNAVSFQRVLVVVIVIILFILLNLFIKNTKIGKAIRAASQDMETAELIGININQIYSIIFIIGGALSGFAAAMIIPIYNLNPMIGEIPLFKAMAVVIIGGLGSITGALYAGIGLGILESFGAYYISSAYQHGFAFILLLSVLILRPQGLFGKRD